MTLTVLLARGVALLMGFAVHESAHAFVAYLLGDSTAKQQGRLTLNPLVHLDPLGAIMALLVGFGWAKPVPVSPWRLRYGPRVGNAIVAAAGPLSNLLLALVVALPWRLGLLDTAPRWLLEGVYTVILLNVALFVFNLLPIGPLDGISVLSGVVGSRGAELIAPLQIYGPQILMGLILIGFIVPAINPLGIVLVPAMRGITQLLLG